MTSVESRLRKQGAKSAEYGSALMEALLSGAADDVATGGVVADLLEPHADDPPGSALALRFAGSLHRLVLERKAPGLALHYPSVGGTAPPEQVWPAAERACREHLDALRSLVRRPVQTNEPGRAAALYGVLVLVTAATGLPVRLLEVGASAGLNLHCDAFAYELADDVVLGDPGSRVRLVRPWQGRHPPPDVVPDVVRRAGCDPAPVDPTTADGRTTLTSYVWGDQVERLERLRAALDVAARRPVDVRPVGAGEFLRSALAEPADGVVTVVWHSVVWQYLTPAQRQEVEDLLARAGRSARAPLVLAGMEPEQLVEGETSFAVRARTWPGGEEVHLAACHGHGPPVRWTGNPLALERPGRQAPRP